MKLPKHKMQKVKPPRQQSGKRTAKHKKNFSISSSTSVTASALGSDAHGSSNKKSHNPEADMDLSDNDAMVDEDDSDFIDDESTRNEEPRRLKTKEEKAAIREKRKKANRTKNLYKRRNGNCTGRNGPRAINPSSNI